jgi:hypothetical protein
MIAAITRRRLVIVLSTLALLLAACSVPRDDKAKPVDAQLIPALGPQLSECTDLTEFGAESVLVYAILTQENNAVRTLEPIERYALSARPKDALERLFECPPTETEAKRGLTTEIPKSTLDDVKDVGGGTYEVSLRNLPSSNGQTEELSALAVGQIVYTLTEFPGVNGVLFTIGGEPRGVNTDGATTQPGTPVGRQDFSSSAPTTTTTTTTSTSTTTTTTTTTTSPPPADGTTTAPR